MTESTGRNGHRHLLWSAVAAGVSLIAAGCTSMPEAVSQPIQAVREIPSKLTRKSRDDAKLKRQAEEDPFPTRSEAAAKMAARVQ